MNEEIVKILFPEGKLVSPEMLETASELGILELQRYFGSRGGFLRPGVFAPALDTNKLLPVTTPSGITVSAGRGITSSGYFVSVATGGVSWTTDLASNLNKTLFIKYHTDVDDTIQSLDPTSGIYEDVATIKSQDGDSIFFWATYTPSSDPTMTLYPDSIPLGKLIQVGGNYSFLLGDGHRRLALPLIPFVDVGHYDGEFTPNVESFCSLYEFLSSCGHSTRSTTNPFGLSTTDISLLLATVKSIVYRAGIPAQDLLTDDNKDYLKCEVAAGFGGEDILVNSGMAIDWEGHLIDVSANQVYTKVPDDNTWYYFAIKYYETTGSKDYYEFTLTTADYGQSDRVNLARVKKNGGVLSIIDERQTMLCRGYYPVQVAPGVPTDLELETGYDDENIHSDVDTVYGTGASSSMRERRAGNSLSYITATWTASSGDPIAYELTIVPLTNLGVPIDDQRSRAKAIITTNPTPDNYYTFHNMQTGVKYQVKVRSVGRPPTHAESSWSTADTIIAGVGDVLTMSPITLTEKYFGGNVSSGQAQSETTTRYQPQGIEVSWVAVVGAYQYEVYGMKNSTPNIDTPASRRACDFVWRGTNLKCFIPAIDGEKWYVRARCYDSGGFPSDQTTAQISFGDATPPSIPTNLNLETGLMDDIIPPAQMLGRQAQPVLPRMAYIRASWTASTDNKTGVARYDIWIAPDKRQSPGTPDADLMMIAMSYQQSVSPPVYYTFLNLRAGVKYWVKVRAVDGRGNMSDFCSPVSIVAGNENLPSPVQPILMCESATNAVKIQWDTDPNAIGYEVFVRESADPGTNPDIRWLYTTTPSNMVVYNVPTSGTSKYLYVRVRPYNGAGFYGEISDVQVVQPTVLDATAFATAMMTISDAEGILQEVVRARRDFEDMDGRMLAMESAQGFNWEYVRVVAKSGGQYRSIQQAVDSIPDNVHPYLIIIVHDGGDSINTINDYDQSVDIGDKWVGFLGIGQPTIGPNYGRITSTYAGYDAGHIWKLDSINVICNNEQTFNHLVLMGKQNSTEIPVVRNCLFYHRGITPAGDYPSAWKLKNFQAGTVAIDNCRIRVDGTNTHCIAEDENNANHNLTCSSHKLMILRSRLYAASGNCVYIKVKVCNIENVFVYDNIMLTNNGTSPSCDCYSSDGTYNLKASGNRWNVVPILGGGHWTTIDYGSFGSEISNVTFDKDDLWVDII